VISERRGVGDRGVRTRENSGAWAVCGGAYFKMNLEHDGMTTISTSYRINEPVGLSPGQKGCCSLYLGFQCRRIVFLTRIILSPSLRSRRFSNLTSPESISTTPNIFKAIRALEPPDMLMLQSPSYNYPTGLETIVLVSLSSSAHLLSAGAIRPVAAARCWIRFPTSPVFRPGSVRLRASRMWANDVLEPALSFVRFLRLPSVSIPTRLCPAYSVDIVSVVVVPACQLICSPAGDSIGMDSMTLF